MKAKTLSNEIARRVMEAKLEGKDHKILASDLGEVGFGESWDESKADEVSEKFLNIKNEILVSGKKLDVNTFDRRAAVILHRELSLPPNLVASSDFWRYLAVVKFRDVIEARHTGAITTLHRSYGIDVPITADRLAILWYRADMVYDPTAKDHYHLCVQPAHTDFWESCIIRHRYGWCRNLARLLVRFQYRDPSSSKAHLHSTRDRGIRELYKRLRRLHSSISFEYLSDDQIWNILEEKSAGLILA